MDFSLGDDAEQFRTQVKAFLATTWKSVPADRSPDPRSFEANLARQGWLTLAWPRRYGGEQAGHLRQLVFNEELAYAGAPTGNHGVSWVGPTLMLHGSDAQRARYLPPIARAAEYWCTLYSEPGAGSDLASLQTRAVRDGDDFVINGQKIWSGRAHYADFGWLAARTDASGPKHRGITLFIVDMHARGVSVRPLLDMSGRHHFNEVFFEDVRVPATNVVGEVGAGWRYITGALDLERSGIQHIAWSRSANERTAAELRSACRADWQRARLRAEVAERAIEIAVGANLAYRVALMQAAGKGTTTEASISRVFGTLLLQRTTLTAAAVAGLPGQAWAGADSRSWDVATPYLISASETIAAGTTEIQRGIIATRGLGMPRG